MKKIRRTSIVILIIAIMLLRPLIVIAASSDTSISIMVTAKENKTYNVGEEVTFTVSWNAAAEAAQYVLAFDKEKLEYLRCMTHKGEVESDFINEIEIDKNGGLNIAWVIMQEEDTSIEWMEIVFQAKKAGTANVELVEVRCSRNG